MPTPNTRSILNATKLLNIRTIYRISFFKPIKRQTTKKQTTNYIHFFLLCKTNKVHKTRWKISTGLLKIMILILPSMAFSSPNDELILNGKYELTIGTRPSAPYNSIMNYNTSLTQQGMGAAYPTAVSRHHIIPFNVLRTFYNLVVSQNRFRNLRSFFSEYANNIRHYASVNGVGCNNIGTDLLDAGNLAQAHSFALIHGGGSIIAPGFDTFEQFYAWLPGNLFIGPSNRLDDPLNGFESNAHIVVGREYFDILARTNSRMQQYINGDHSTELLRSITVDLAKIANRKRIFQLNPENWVYEKGQYKLNENKYASHIIEQEKNTLPDDECINQSPNLLQKLITSTGEI